MTDILLGIGIIWLLAAGLFLAALWVGARVKKWTATLLVLPASGLIALHAFVLIDNPKLAWLLPVSSLVVVGNWSPLGVGWLAGMGWRHLPKPIWRRLLLVRR